MVTLPLKRFLQPQFYNQSQLLAVWEQSLQQTETLEDIGSIVPSTPQFMQLFWKK